MSTVEVKTADLIGPALDWAVGEAIGAYRGLWKFASNDEIGQPALIFPDEAPYKATTGRFEPSTNWGDGGPLIDKHRFEFEWVGSDWHGEPLEFFTACGCDMPADATSAGPTHLIAACRAIVAAKLGDTVQIPAELA